MARGRKKAKKARKARKSKGPSQRAKFRTASAMCRRQVGDSGVKAFSPASWKAFGSCMKRAL
jgi:hypothetical protein